MRFQTSITQRSRSSPNRFGGERFVSSPRQNATLLVAAVLLASLACGPFRFVSAADPPAPSVPVDYAAAWTMYQTGKYEQALEASEQATKEFLADVRWWRLRLDCLATLGRHREAAEELKLALRRYYSNGSLRVTGAQILRRIGQGKDARELLNELLRIASYSPWQLRAADERTWVGRAAVMMEVDARQVLEQFYDQAKKLNPDLRDVYVATGELALRKQDHGVAIETYGAALEKFPDDPDFLAGLAEAAADESPAKSRELLEKALARNPRHLASLLLAAEDALAHEDFSDARAALDKVLAIDPTHPRAWALRAVLAHLENDPDQERACREWALCSWDANPEVDHWIGAKLSSAYRFAEGAAYQRRALEMDPAYLPARTQLANDLLRLGESEEGWRLVDEVQKADGYNVVAYNLATLHDHLTNYVTLETPHFQLQMERREAAVYGRRVLALLERARQTLGEKYGWQPSRPITVELLNDQKDFAIRTFGFPGGDGILGVCFGVVITANSPAARPGRETNWEATLWHEYCHVVTLELTGHRIPRWLSEGISVYEERQANPTWGDRLNRDTRAMILADQMPRVSELNQAFRRPRSAEHFNLAYYQASLVVEFLVKKFGHDALRKILVDVTAGVSINDALGARIGSLDLFEKGFDQYAREVAKAYGAGVDWNDEDLPPLPERAPVAVVEAWLKDRPKHYRGRLRLAQAQMQAKNWTAARKTLESLVADAPQWAGDDSPYRLLGEVLRETKDVDGELRVLETSAARSDAAIDTYRRLIELAAARRDGPALRRNVERFLAVQPLDEYPYRMSAELSPTADALPTAIDSARALLALDPVDPSGAHFLLAKLLHSAGDPTAKRHALLALEQTPRFRDAQKLLLKIVEPK